MADLPDDLLGMPPLDLGETMAPQSPPPAQPSAKNRAKDFAPLLALLPIVAAKGGQAGVAALLQGFSQARQQGDATARQTQQDAERQRQVQEQERIRRATLQQNTQNDAAMRRQQFMTTFQNGLQSETLDSPEAVRAFMEFYRPQAQSLGLRPDALDAVTMEAMTPTRFEKKEASKVIEAAKKQYGEQAPANSYTLKDGTQASWEELNRRSGVTLGATTPKADVPNTPEEAQIADVVAIAEEKLGRKLTTAERADARIKAVKAFGDARRMDPAPSGADKPLTTNQRANVISSRRNQWTRFTKAILDRQQSIAKVDSGLAALDRGNRNAATQAIILAFNKLQDETSVVREGEYARSEDLAPIVSKVEAFFVKLTQGGGVLTDAELRSLGFEAKALAQRLEVISTGAAANLRQGIEEELSDYKIPASRVFGGSTLGAGGATPGAPSSGGGAWTDAGGGFKVRQK